MAIISTCMSYLTAFEKNSDPRVRNWFLMQSPLIPLIILVSWLYFVIRLGPRLMKDRPPLKIESIIVLYNAVQVILSAYLIKEACRTLWFKPNYNFLCIEIDYTDTEGGIEQAGTVWLYLMTKLFDLLDTVFFVLRKKSSHVSFLHVYHHTLVFTFSWVVTKFYPGGHIAFFGTVNAFVHMIMYSYYLITATHFVNTKSLWWKKYITQLQLIQFVVTGLHAITALVHDCNFPKFIIAFGIPQDILMIVLFLDFYRKTYSKKSTETGAKLSINKPIKSE